MKKTLLLLSFIASLAGLFTACSSATDPSELYKDETPQQIYQKGRAALQERSYNEAVKRFEALSVQYPFSPETESAQLYLIYAYYMREDYTLSVATADHFIRVYPTDPHVDYAYYMRGMADYYQDMGVLEKIFSVDLATRDLAQIQKSYNDFNELTVRFPDSRYTPSAHQYMIYLRNVMADHELHIAEYYYDRRAYVAAANRGSELVAHYQGAPTVPKALELMIKSYHQLGMTKLEQDTLRVFRYNYPTATINYRSDYPNLNSDN